MTIIVRDPSVGQGPVVRDITAGASTPTRDLILPIPPSSYDAYYERERNRILEAHNHTRSETRLILYSPDGTAWSLTVDNAGALVAVAL